MRIHLPKMMRHWREQQFAKGLSPPVARYGTRLWAFVAKRPALYRHGGARVLVRDRAPRPRAVALAACRSPAAGPARAT